MKNLVAAALLLGSATPALAQESYRATGTEPFWSLTIGARTMRFEAPERAPISVATPNVIHGFAGEIWQTPRIGVNTVHKSCSDGMSDRTYRDAVTVTVDGRRYEGCGGGTVNDAPARNMLEGEWTIRSVNGRPIAPRTSPNVTFRGDRISGDASCNQFDGSYRFSGGRLTTGPLVATLRACMMRSANVQEATILRILGQRLSVSRNRGGKLVLTSRRGETIVLARGGRR